MSDVLYDTALDAEYRSHLASGEFRLQCCTECGTFRHPARFACAKCLSDKWSWTAVSGEGVIETFVWYCEPVDPRFAKVPYNVALVRLREGPGMFANIAGAGMDDLAVGQAVRAEIGAVNGRPVVHFTQAGATR